MFNVVFFILIRFKKFCLHLLWLNYKLPIVYLTILSQNYPISHEHKYPWKFIQSQLWKPFSTTEK